MIIGVLGGGQLGRMLALAGYPLDLRFRFLEPAPEAPVGILAEQLQGQYDDPKMLADFVRGLDCVTYEFESIPVAALLTLSEHVPVFPPPTALAIAQDRLNEKKMFEALGIRTPPFAAVSSREDLRAAVEQIGLPALLKTRCFGYDGKGQFLLRTPADVDLAWDELGSAPLILEAFIRFDREVSVLAVRGRDGSTAFYPLVENRHRHGILRLSLAPAPNLDAELQQAAEQQVGKLLDALDYVGVLAVEFFQVGRQLLANEMAPRVHNSGHWTIEGAETTQFENHLRAILKLPLGVTAALGHCAMVNLIGTLPDVAEVCAVSGAHLHLYGKQPRPGRKLGHITICTHSQTELNARLAQLRLFLKDAEVAVPSSA